MTRIRFFALLSTLILALLAAACGNRGPEPQASAATSADEAETAAPSAGSEGIAYEPAFPDDVSAERLNEEDVAQQEATHSHGGEEHSHDEGGHTHDDGETHDDHEH